jgi:GNAT superfamily N-acetyltransferase
MHIQPLSVQDTDIVSQISLRAFMEGVADTVKPEGVEAFKALATPEAYKSRMESGNVILAAKEGAQIVGVIELKEGKHLAMLFVDPCAQRRGVGQALLSAILPFVKVDPLSVRASLPSVPFYERCGFVKDGDIAEVSGLVYQTLYLAIPYQK